MSVATVFTIASASVLPAWLLLALAPRWVWTQRIVHSLLFPLALGALYGAALATAPPMPEGASFGSLAGTMKFFTVPQAMLVGWVHYLVFDLFVGAWEVRDAQRLGIPHLAVVPCLLLTLMAGPVGPGLYGLLRLALRRDASLVETRP